MSDLLILGCSYQLADVPLLGCETTKLLKDQMFSIIRELLRKHGPQKSPEHMLGIIVKELEKYVSKKQEDTVGEPVDAVRDFEDWTLPPGQDFVVRA